MKPIDPFAYSHLCDHSASYQPKPKPPADRPNWTGVSDVTGRGFTKPITGLEKELRNSKRRSNVKHNLDEGNRFFDDNKRIYENFNEKLRTSRDTQEKWVQQNNNEQDFQQRPTQNFYKPPVETRDAEVVAQEAQHTQDQQVQSREFQVQETQTQNQQGQSKQKVRLQQSINKPHGYTPKLYSSKGQRPQSAAQKQNASAQQKTLNASQVQQKTQEATQEVIQPIPQTPGKIPKKAMSEMDNQEQFTHIAYHRKSPQKTQGTQYEETVAQESNTVTIPLQMTVDNNQSTKTTVDELSLRARNQLELADASKPGAPDENAKNSNGFQYTFSEKKEQQQQQQPVQQKKKFSPIEHIIEEQRPASGKKRSSKVEEDVWKSSYQSSYQPFQTEIYTVTFKGDPKKKVIIGPYATSLINHQH